MGFRNIIGLGAAWVVAFACVLLGTTPAHAFKSKTHLIIANQVLADVRDGKLSVPGIDGDIDPQNPDLVAALKEYPAAFRAGILGPDNYPDIAGGQFWVHANNGDNLSDQATPFESRKITNWRSIDYGMYLLKQANNYSGTRAQRLQALAFAYGYLGHMVADGFAHSYVNEWAGGAWNYTHGGGMFGPLSEEIKHVAVEGLLDSMIAPVSDSALDVQAPVDFLDSVFRGKLTAGGQAEPAGAFAGDHVVAILELRDKIRRAANGDFGGTFGRIAEIATEIHDAAADAGLPNPIADVQWFLDVRADMLDEIVANLPLISDCMAQNIVLGQNRDDTDKLPKDACDAIDFEPHGSLSEFVFDGALNIAAHNGGDDAGSFKNNVQRLADYLLVVIDQGLRFDPKRDLRSVGQINKAFDQCEKVINWGTCEDACSAAQKTCTKLVKEASCPGCPKKHGHYTCSGWKNGIKCGAMPHCVACAGLPLWEEVTDASCQHAVNDAAPICQLCQKNDLCLASESIETLQEYISGPIDMAVDEAMQPIQDIAISAVMGVVFGRYYDDAQDALELYDRRKKRGKAVWLVNAAFFREDMRAGGREYMIKLFNQAAKVPMAAMSTAQSASQFASSTWKYMTGLSPMGEEIVWGDENTHADDFEYYYNFIQFLYGLTDGSSEAVLKDEKDYWANRVRVQKENRRSVTLNFVRLLDTLGMLHTLTGPTATALAQDIAGQSFDPAHFEDVQADIGGFAPAYNAVQLTKLSLSSGAALSDLFGDLMKTRSVICRQNPHIMCDGIASLDDPNHHGPSGAPDAEAPPSDQRFPSEDAFDAQRSVSLWAPRRVVWGDDSIGPRSACISANTAFALTSSTRLTRDSYEHIFVAPNGCITSWLLASFISMH